MADFNTMGMFTTAILVTINIGLLVMHCTAGAALLPDQTASVVSDSAEGTIKLTALLPGGFQVCEVDADGNVVSGGTTDLNYINPDDLQIVAFTDENVTITDPSNNVLGVIPGVVGMLLDSGLLVIRMATWLLFGYALVMFAVPMPAEMVTVVLIFGIPLLILQVFFIVSIVASIVGAIRQ